MADSAYDYITTTGVIVPDTESLLLVAQNQIKTVFGSDTIVTPDTPQGLLAVGDALVFAAVTQNNAAVANQINPNINGGVFQDAVGTLTGIQRIAATQTVIPNVVVTGIPGTVIPIGSRAQTAAGDIFQSLSGVVLDASGNGSTSFASVEFGPIPCSIGSLTQLVSNVLGWETVNNPVTATIGQNTQSDQSFRAYRNNTLGFQGVALPVAATSALYAVTGVQSLTYQENVESSAQVINGITMQGHSIYACVSGGSDTDVAAALLENKSSGCNWNGSTQIAVIEPASGQTYAVKFDRPTQIGLIVRVTSAGDRASIVQAILDYAAGNINGLPGWGVGVDISTWDIGGAIITEFPNIFVNKVELSLASGVPSFSTDVRVIAVNQIATIIADNIIVVLP